MEARHRTPSGVHEDRRTFHRTECLLPQNLAKLAKISPFSPVFAPNLLNTSHKITMCHFFSVRKRCQPLSPPATALQNLAECGNGAISREASWSAVGAGLEGHTPLSTSGKYPTMNTPCENSIRFPVASTCHSTPGRKETDTMWHATGINRDKPG